MSAGYPTSSPVRGPMESSAAGAGSKTVTRMPGRITAMAVVSLPTSPMTIGYSTDRFIRLNLRVCLTEPGRSDSRSTRWPPRSLQILYRSDLEPRTTADARLKPRGDVTYRRPVSS